MAGAVRIGGTEPHGLGYEDLVAGATLMEQDSQLLSGTVADNLRLARPDAGADELREAMKVAVLAGHVDLASQLGPGGEGLSGGQRRRLGVAQAYLRHPGLLLLDEPTEGLDHHTARALLENLRSALPAPPSSPPFTTARLTICQCPRMPPSGSLRAESSGDRQRSAESGQARGSRSRRWLPARQPVP
jgi:hypothetical protein